MTIFTHSGKKGQDHNHCVCLIILISDYGRVWNFYNWSSSVSVDNAQGVRSKLKWLLMYYWFVLHSIKMDMTCKSLLKVQVCSKLTAGVLCQHECAWELHCSGCVTLWYVYSPYSGNAAIISDAILFVTLLNIQWPQKVFGHLNNM